MSIESKIRFKAVGLYLVIGIGVVGMVIYLYQLRNNIKSQKKEIENQHYSLALTNELIYAVGDAQSSVSQFVSTRDTLYIEQFALELAKVDSLIDTLVAIEPVGKTKLNQISELLARQTTNVTALNKQFSKGNPITPITERIRKYSPKRQVETQIVTVTEDTVINTPKKKGFFKRIKEVFDPEKNKSVVVTRQRVDTLHLKSQDSLPILTEVADIARTAGESYEKNLAAISRQVSELIASDREISNQISGLLLELHRQTLSSVLDTIAQSERSINRNYSISIIGGIFALGLILLFIVLIIYDVNKGGMAREKLRQVMESRHKLLLSVSHDIKSPLGSILGYLELHKKLGEDTKSMQSSARHILALLENLLEFSSLEQGSLKISRSAFSLNAVCEEIGQMFLPLANAKKLSFTFQSDNVRVNSDYMKIKQVIINLVSNAIKYTRAGEISLQINYIDGNLNILVTDTGVGIPKDKLAEIYKPFTRVESNNALAHGSGLGMFVVKGLIELLNGTIQVASKVGEGTQVNVIIPCDRVEFDIKTGAKRVAIYDDDPVVAEIASEMLIRLGHKIVEEDFDIILTDMEMGDITGLDILANAGNIPVIIMTGRSDFTAEKAHQLGFDGFLAKPFTLDTLREIFGEGDIIKDDLWGDDMDEILEIFRASTTGNFKLLKQSLDGSDFRQAQAICHKMLPMFAQFGYPTEELRRMDANRGDAYDGWQSDVEKILSIKV